MIRAATISDVEAIASIHVRGWQQAYRGQLPDDFLDSLSVAQREVSWADLLCKAGATVFVVVSATDQVEGFIHYGASRDPEADEKCDGEIYAVYLLPAVLGQGKGRELMVFAERSLRSAGYREVVLWVLESNIRARAFYEMGGFQSEGLEKHLVIGAASYAERRYRKVLV